MPELPEVETIKKQMEEELVEEEIVGVEVRDSHCYEGELVEEEKIVGIGRLGKYLFVEFESGRGWQVHLKMTGRLIVQSSKFKDQSEINYERAPHTRVVVTLKSGRKIFYWDTRMFGYLWTQEDIKQAEEKVKMKLGKDPWEMSEMELLRKLQKTGRSVKDAILDQSLIAGVGNIYANDALFLSGIDPRRKANTIKVSEVKRLLNAIREVMEKGLELGGASDNTYRDLYGEKGGYQNEFLVYGKTGGVCPQCGRELLYCKISGRGSWICESCQV